MNVDGTYRPRSMQRCIAGYAVNRVGPCERLDPSPRFFTDHHAAVLRVRTRAHEAGANVGIWTDDGTVIVDVVDVYPTRRQAMSVARERGQRYIGNIAQNTIEPA